VFVVQFVGDAFVGEADELRRAADTNGTTTLG
jgi:hypothetical protein